MGTSEVEGAGFGIARPATIERPSAAGRMYHDAWMPLWLRASYPIRRRYDDVEMTGLLQPGSHRPRTHQWGVEFKTYIAYDRLVRAARPTRDGR
jgi:hypothetical protein